VHTSAAGKPCVDNQHGNRQPQPHPNQQGDQYSGPNRVHNGTLYAYAATKYGIKESQVRGRRWFVGLVGWVWLVGRGWSVWLGLSSGRRLVRGTEVCIPL